MTDADDLTDFAERRAQAIWWQCVAAAVMATLALAPWDVAISRAVYLNPTHSIGRIASEFVKALGSGGGVVAILIAVVIMDRRVVARLPQLLTAAAGAGLIANCLKLCVDRGRPYSLDLATATFSSTFHGWFPLLPNTAGEQSFPSSHSATIAGLAIALAILYPRGRWLFGLLVAAVMTQRVVSHAHFPTDAMIGAILGAVWGRQCFRGVLGRKFATLGDKIDDKIADWVNRRARRADGLASELSVARTADASQVTSQNGDVTIPESNPRRRSA